jgi:hypothetical protein
MNINRALTLVLLALFVLVACGQSGSEPGGTAGGAVETNFPIPDSVSDFVSTGAEGINFATTLSLEEAIAFYRDAFEVAGLIERSINTAITDATFSLVFDGDPSGQAIVVQGVDLGNGNTNVNIRYEDV